VTDRVRPDYAGGSILNVVASIAAHFGVATGHAPLREPLPFDGHDAVVLLIVDALGHGQLERHLADGDMPFLAARLVNKEAILGSATSVFPSTTAAALSALHSGRAPAESGMLGYTLWLPERAAVGEMIRFWDLVANQPLARPAELTLGEPVYSRLRAAGVACRVVSADAYRGSAFSRWLFGETTVVGYASANTLPSQVAAALEGSGKRYVAAYWPSYDAVCHAQGPTGREAGDEAAAVDHCLARLVASLRNSKALLLIAADHGQAALDPEQAVDLKALLGDLLFSPPGGERGGRFLRPRPGAADEVVARLEGIAEVVTTAELWDQGWFGGPPARPDFRERVGELLAVPGAGRQLIWPYRRDEPVHRGGHGGWSADEMLVPVVALPLG
jgi:hypothetical protein